MNSPIDLRASTAPLTLPPLGGVKRLTPLPRVRVLASVDELDEEQLVALLIRRDQGAFVRIYREHAPLITRVLARMGVGQQDTEDLLQTTFTEAMSGVARFEGRSTIRGWLLGVALNQARNHIRGRVQARASAPQLASHGAAESPSAEEMLSGAQQLDRLQRALDRLPAIQREALVLCELGDLPAREVSSLLGVPAGTVWRRVHDAKASLRKALLEGDDQ